jgi:hypothetical protein
MKFKETYKYINPSDCMDIFSNPKWYLEIRPELKEFFYDYDGNKKNKSREWLDKRGESIKMVCDLEHDPIALGDSGEDWVNIVCL